MTEPATNIEKLRKLWEDIGLAAVVFGTGWSDEIDKMNLQIRMQ